MQAPKSWKIFNDDWNSENYQLDCNNKLLYLQDNNSIDSSSSTSPGGQVQLQSQNNSENSFNLNEVISTTKMLDIIKLNNFSINKIDDLTIIENIIKVIGWCIQNSNNVNKEYNNFLEAIKWTCKTIEYFITELNIPISNNKQYTGLTRSSYKLCPNKSNCVYQYPDNNIGNHCKFQHFPYDNLYNDCNSILQFFTFQFKNNEDLPKTSKLIIALNNFNNKSFYDEDSTFDNTNNNNTDKDFNGNELKRCLTTLNFVFMIMFRELDTINRLRKSEPNYNIRKYHSYHTLFKYANNSDGNRDRDNYKNNYGDKTRFNNRKTSHSSFSNKVTYGRSSNNKPCEDF